MAKGERQRLGWNSPQDRGGPSGQGFAIAKAEAIRDAIQPALIDGFPHDAGARESPTLPVSLPGAPSEPIQIREDLTWNPDYLGRFVGSDRYSTLPSERPKAGREAPDAQKEAALWCSAH